MTMSWIQVVVLSVVQGITEFLPVSSSGHLAIVSQLLFHADAGASFTAVIQLGTEAAAIVYFFPDIAGILRAWSQGIHYQIRHRCWQLPQSYQNLHYTLGWYVIIATIPIVIIGVLCKKIIRSEVRDLSVVCWALILFSIVIALSEYYGPQTRHENQFRSRDAFLIGLGQTLALIPGVSRSGATISTGLFLGLDRHLAARFGFLMAIPAVLAAGLYSLPDAFHPSQVGLAATGAQLGIGTVIAFVVGWVVISWFLEFLTTHSMYWFVCYRMIAGSTVLCLPIASAPMSS